MLAYLPALTAAPGRMPSDSKLYVYLNPGRFFGDAATTFDGRQFAGWVPHQHIAYLWPSNPWFWTFETLGVPDWIAHRLWVGTILLAAGLGVRWCARLLGLGAMAAFTAAIVYQLSPYVLPYVSRTSVMLLPWAGLGWVVAFMIRATRRSSWADPAAIALVVFTVGAVNATALAMIVPAPALWLAHSAWAKTVTWHHVTLVAMRTAVLSMGVSLWWIAMLMIQGQHGTDVLQYSESLADVSLTATSPETWRGLGYWLFYVRDPYAATTTESLRYLSSTVSIVVSYVLPLAALTALVGVRWAHRRFAAGLIGVGLVLAVGVHPIGDRSPLMRLLAGDDDAGLALALRSSTRALPLVGLGVALALAMAVDACGHLALLRRRVPVRWLAGGTVALLAVVNLPSLWTGAFVDPALERDQDPPLAWQAAVDALDESTADARVLQLPGAEFGAYRWGYTVDQPLPALTDRPIVTRDLLPLGSAGAMDLLYALDDRLQDGVLEPEAVAPVARMLGADTIWLTNDIAFDRFRTARPEIVRDIVGAAPDVRPPTPYGELFLNRPDIPMTDERAVGDPRVGQPIVPVELAELEQPGRIVRVAADTVLLAGSGDGLVDAAAAGLLEPSAATVRYTADLDHDELTKARDEALGLVVTDSNRDRARHWRSSQDTTGFTETGGPEQDLLRPVSTDARLEVFATDDPSTQTVAVQRGPATASATSYGEPFAYVPEHRPVMAIDGDHTTAWLVGEHGDPIGETLRLEFDEPVAEFIVHQPQDAGARRITGISLVGVVGTGGAGTNGLVELSESSWDGTGQTISVGEPIDTLEITIATVAGGNPFTGSAVAPVGFTEVETSLGATLEVVRPPVDTSSIIDTDTPLAFVFTRLRTDPMDRWRDDPEPKLVRSIELPVAREFGVEFTGRVDARASDADLATLLGWPAVASSRLTGSPRHAGIAALDGDLGTAWITAFDGALGATLTTTASEPISEVTVQQPVTGFSRVTRLIIRAGGEERTVELVPDAAGASRGVIDPPLAAGPVAFVVSDVTEETTFDRRFGDPVALPASITELGFNGRPAVSPVADTNVSLPCLPIGTLDGRLVSATIDIRGDAWLDGTPVALAPCEPSVSMTAGSHLLALDPPDLPITIDRVVLDGAFRAALDLAAPAPAVQIVDRGRFDRSIRVGACPSGCWVVVGEGWNTAWTASGPDGDLGAPTLVDGGFNGWWLAPTDEPTLITVRWTAQRALNWALVLSALAALASIGLIAWSHFRMRPSDGPAPQIPAPVARFDAATLPPTLQTIVTSGVIWTALAVLLIGPEWALGGLLGGLMLLLVRYRRTPELAALASLLVVAALVVVRERRSAPPANGGWPGSFESLHGIGMFAIVCVLTAALIADDADPVGEPRSSDAAVTDHGVDR